MCGPRLIIRIRLVYPVKVKVLGADPSHGSFGAAAHWRKARRDAALLQRNSMRAAATFLCIQSCDVPQFQRMGRRKAPQYWRKETRATASFQRVGRRTAAQDATESSGETTRFPNRQE
ncbi:hypothetical protein HAX54_021374 [Datura stramonium]|uniref:Uncharacterized protein n=1 Tax=Datura stramonium TaxID=4076 RepID=A0ABS8USK8_DATST|nr:hypothetical protein [Datura stramonium]